MKKEFFGNLKTGEKIHKYTIKNENITAVFMDRGATLISLYVNGTDVVGGFDTLEDYLSDSSHQGGIIGRVANRIENAKFNMNGKTYYLPKNDGDNCLHGGEGFDFKLWHVAEYSDEKITFRYTSPCGEEGFPSELETNVTYTLSNNDLIIEYSAVPNGKTPISLTNHSYFNLDGFGGDIKKHKLIIYADKYSEINSALIPTGKHPAVSGTVFDFTSCKEIGENIEKDFLGYDHNYLLSPKSFESFNGKNLGLCATVYGKHLKMSVYTDQPGVQLYTGNFLGDGPDFKGGIKQIRHGAFCLETQTEPNSVNHGVGFYEKGEKYIHTTVYRIENIR